MILFNIQKEDYITIEIGEDTKSDDKMKSFKSDNGLKCDPIGLSDSISNSSTSETLIDVPLTDAQYSEESIFKNDNDKINEHAGYESISTGIQTPNSKFIKDPVLLVTIPSTQSTVSDTVTTHCNSNVTAFSTSVTKPGDESETTSLQDTFVCDPVPFEKIKTTSSGNKLLRAQTMSCSRDASPNK